MEQVLIFNIYKIYSRVMWSSLERRSGTQLGHVKRDIPGFDTVFYSNLSSLRRKYLSNIPTDKIVLSCGPEI